MPLKPAEDLPPAPPAPRLAPPWVSFSAAWVGLLAMLLSFAIPFVPGSRDPRAELTHATAYSWADRLLLIAMYLQPAALFLGIVPLWQMRREPRPLSDALLIQRLQAWVGILLALVGAAFVYIFVFFRGPGAGG